MTNYMLTGSYAEPEYLTDAQRELLEEIKLQGEDLATDRWRDDGV